MLPTSCESHPHGRVRVARLGQGPPLVLLHGYPDNLQIYSALAPRLAAQHQVTLFDWPGLGWSDTWPGGTTPEHQAGRLGQLLDAWGLARVSLVGMDMGGQPALAFAALQPERVRALVVMNSLVIPDQATSLEIRLLRRYRWNERLLRLLPRAVFWQALRTSLPPRARLPPELRADLWQAFRQPAVRRFVSRLCGGYQGALPALPALYGQVRSPTLALWGERDRHFPPGHARGLCALVPGCELQILEGAEHWMVWHRAEQVAERLLAFLARRAA